MSLFSDYGGIDLAGSSILGVPYDDTFEESGASATYGSTNYSGAITFLTTGTEIYGTAGGPSAATLDLLPIAAGNVDPQICWFSFEGAFNSALAGKTFGMGVGLSSVRLKVDGNTGLWYLGAESGGAHGAVAGVYQKFDVIIMGTVAMVFIDGIFSGSITCVTVAAERSDGLLFYLECTNVGGMTIVESPSIKNIGLWTGNLGSPE